MPASKHSLLFSLLVLATAPAFAAEPSENWSQHCARCHGDDGKGATKTGRKLKIRDLTLEKVQRRVTDAEIAELIAQGYKDNDGGERMPAFAAKIPEAERQALVSYVRSLKAP
jgi:mono/diheme cytochrome c family protein